MREEEKSDQEPCATGIEALSIATLDVALSDHFRLTLQDITVPEGARLCIVGHNGAGKSCLLEYLAGIRRAPTARIRIFCHTPDELNAHPQLRRSMGVQLQRTCYPGDLTIRHVVALHGALYGDIDKSVGPSLGITELMSSCYGALSRGQRQRVDLYMALAHRPKLAFLDEPTSTLDSHYANQLVRLLSVEQKQTVIMTSHSDIEVAASTWILWLSRGRSLGFGRRDALVSSAVGKYKGEIRFAHSDDAIRCADMVAKRTAPRVLRIVENRTVRLYTDGPVQPIVDDYLSVAEYYAFGRVTYSDFLSVAALGESP